MAVFTLSANDPAIYTSDKFPLLKDGDGNTYRTVVNANVNGNYDVYSKGTGLFGGDELIYQYNASTNVVDFRDGKFKGKSKDAYDSFFKSTRGNGIQFNRDVKIRWYQEAPPNATTRMATLAGYAPIAARVSPRSQGTTVPQVTIQTASGPLTVTSPGAGSTTSITGTSTTVGNVAAKGRNTPGTYGDLVYPLDIKTTAQDVIRFKILKFQPSGLNISGALSGGATLGGNRKSTNEKDNKRDVLGTIILPIPGNISDTNSCNWGDDKLDAFTAVAANAAMDAIKTNLSAGANTLLQAGQGAAGAGNNDVKEALAATIAKQAVGGGANILGRTQGAVFNENLELLFSGPELRSFSFTFKMSARSKSEANEIVKIIRAFKQSMSAQTTESSIFLKAPNTYEIAYLRRQKNGKGDTVHTRLGKIKECALLTLTTNYAPEGQYAVYNDGTPISYEIQMQFKELEPVFNVEYGDETKDIGF